MGQEVGTRLSLVPGLPDFSDGWGAFPLCSFQPHVIYLLFFSLSSEIRDTL